MGSILAEGKSVWTNEKNGVDGAFYGGPLEHMASDLGMILFLADRIWGEGQLWLRWCIGKG